MMGTRLLLNVDSFMSDNDQILKNSIEELSGIVLTSEFQGDFCFTYCYSDEIKQQILNIIKKLKLNEDPDAMTVLFQILDKASKIDTEEKEGSFLNSKNEDFLGLLSCSHTEKWRIDILENDCVNVYNKANSLHIFKEHFISKRVNFILNNWSKDFIKLTYESSICSELSEIHFHDDFYKDYNKLNSNGKKIFTEKLISIMNGNLNLNSMTKSYHSESKTTIKDDKKMKKTVTVNFSFIGEKRAIYRHHSMKNGYSYYMEVEKRRLYIGRQIKHL